LPSVVRTVPYWSWKILLVLQRKTFVHLHRFAVRFFAGDF